MAKRKKNKVKNLNSEDLGHIKFELEEDAEDIFLEHVENLSTEKIDKEIIEETSLPRKKASQRKTAKNTDEIVKIDLHGLTLVEAKARVDRIFSLHIGRGNKPIQFRVITGKGLHSGPDGSVLPSEIHRFVKEKYNQKITKITSSPEDVKIAGVPIRGYFDVTVKP